MKRCVSIVLALLLTFTTVPALALEPTKDVPVPAEEPADEVPSEPAKESAEGVSAPEPSAKPAEEGVLEPEAPAQNVAKPAADQAVNCELNTLSAESRAVNPDVQGEGVVEVELGDFRMRAQVYWSEEPPAEAETLLKETMVFKADDASSPNGLGTVVIDATPLIEASVTFDYLTFDVSMKEGVATTENSIEVHAPAAPSNNAAMQIQLTGVNISLVETRWKAALLVAEDSGPLDIQFVGDNVLAGSPWHAGLQKDSDVSSELAVRGSRDAILKATGGSGAAGIGGGRSAGESVVGGMVFGGAGIIKAYGNWGAGIGSGLALFDATATDIAIESGTVKAYGTGGGAGIGAGPSLEGDSSARDLSFMGGTVNAYGYSDDENIANDRGAGIGSGQSNKGCSIASGIRIGEAVVTADGGTTAAGIGSGWSSELSSATNIAITDGDFVRANGGFGAPGIGSGYSDAGDSVTAGLSFIGASEIYAVGGNSDRRTIGGGEAVIGAGAGIGSGWAEKGNSVCNGVLVDGADVTATAGTDNEGVGGAPGLGSGPALSGISGVNRTDGPESTLVISSGSLKAKGGTTTLTGKGPQTLPAIGAGSASTRTVTNATIAPTEDLCANAWRGASDKDNAQFLKTSTDPFLINDETLPDAYLCVVISPEPKLTVEGGVYDTDPDGTIVLTESTRYTVTTNGGVSGNGIRIAEGAAPTVVLDNVNIDLSSYGKSALSIPLKAGEVALVLKGDNALTGGNGHPGIYKEAEEDNPGQKLRITSIEGDGSSEGTLTAVGGSGAAGIGGRVEEFDSITANITIAGGTIMATGGAGAAGIGSGKAPDGVSLAYSLEISGGTVVAEGVGKNAAFAAGIGSGRGFESTARDIIISGGNVTAIGGKNGTGAGIGSGHADKTSLAEDIFISGGTVSAFAGSNAAGIGSGSSATGKSLAKGITVSGGTVFATGRDRGSSLANNVVGIGSGGGATLSEAEAIVITGGTVEAIGTVGGAGIGSGYVEAGGTTCADGMLIAGGIVEAQGAPGGWASDECSYEAPAFGPSEVADTGDNPVSVKRSAVSILAADQTWYTSIWAGASKDDAEAFGLDKRVYPFQFDSSTYPYARITVSPTVTPRLAITTLDGQPVDADEYDYDLTSPSPVLAIKGSGEYRISLAEGIDASRHRIFVENGASPAILLDNVVVSEPSMGSALDCSQVEGDVTILLKGQSYLAGGLGGCGVSAPATGSLTIEGYEEGASLEAVGTMFKAGIGTAASSDENVPLIAINGVAVTARGGTFAAGIGSSLSDTSSVASSIIITDSTVEAVGGDTAPGIGSGYAKAGDSRASHIRIADSDVVATGGAGAPGIGSGYSDEGDSLASDILVAGGTVVATGGPSLREGSGAAEGAVIGAGAGIGSGWAESGASRAASIAIAGGTVTAMGGKDNEGLGAGAGIGSGAALGGESSVSGVLVSGGTLIATGGTTARADAGPTSLPAIGAGTGTTRSAGQLSIAPGEGLWASAWKGATAESAAQFMENRVEAFDLAGVEDAYAKAVLSPVGSQGGGAPTGTTPDAKPFPGALATTGDDAGAPMAIAACIAAIALCAAAVAGVRRRTSRTGR